VGLRDAFGLPPDEIEPATTTNPPDDDPPLDDDPVAGLSARRPEGVRRSPDTAPGGLAHRVVHPPSNTG